MLPLLRSRLIEPAVDTGLRVALGDAQGCLLWIEGRSTIQVVGAEHLHEAVHSWSCSAVPVPNPHTGAAVGVLDVPGSADTVAPLVLSLLEATSRALQEELRRRGPDIGRSPDGSAELLLTGRRISVLTCGDRELELGASGRRRRPRGRARRGAARERLRGGHRARRAGAPASGPRRGRRTGDRLESAYLPAPHRMGSRRLGGPHRLLHRRDHDVSPAGGVLRTHCRRLDARVLQRRPSHRPDDEHHRTGRCRGHHHPRRADQHRDGRGHRPRVRLLDTAVAIRATPVRFHWDLGDGSTITTTNPGEPHPSEAVSATHSQEGWYDVTLTTTFAGQFSVDGGPWQDIDGTIEVASDPVPIYSKSLESRLVNGEVPVDEEEDPWIPERTAETEGPQDPEARAREA